MNPFVSVEEFKIPQPVVPMTFPLSKFSQRRSSSTLNKVSFEDTTLLQELTSLLYKDPISPHNSQVLHLAAATSLQANENLTAHTFEHPSLLLSIIEDARKLSNISLIKERTIKNYHLASNAHWIHSNINEIIRKHANKLYSESPKDAIELKNSTVSFCAVMGSKVNILFDFQQPLVTLCTERLAALTADYNTLSSVMNDKIQRMAFMGDGKVDEIEGLLKGLGHANKHESFHELDTEFAAIMDPFKVALCKLPGELELIDPTFHSEIEDARIQAYNAKAKATLTSIIEEVKSLIVKDTSLYLPPGIPE